VGNHRTASTSRATKTPRRKTTHRRSGSSHGHRLRAEERYPLGDAPKGDGLRIGDDLLATLEGMARGRGVGEAAPSSSRPSRGGRPNRLGACLTRFGFHPGQKGGPKTAANPTDKGKKGTKRHLVSDRRGIPLAVVLTAANVHDSMVFEELLDAVEPIKRPGRGRPRRRPEKLHAYTKPTTIRSAREL
jgi:IS5 family transposase